MEYNANPSLFVGVESGHVKGPGKNNTKLTSVETLSISEVAEEGEDKTRNVIVITVDDLYEKSENRRSMRQMALKVNDCRTLVRDLLIHLAYAGDDVAQFLISRLGRESENESESE